jgi:hypothetical protein
MARSLTHWLTSLAVLMSWAVAAPAQDATEGPATRVPVLGYFLAFLFVVLSLVIVCMPSRKA